MNELNGVLPVDKPEGPTSHDVVAIARRALRTRRIGHTGTLDPFASGLLLLCLGPSTRLAEYLTSLTKSYTATIRLGAATDTDDLTGEVCATQGGWGDVTREAAEQALARQVGTILQRPPAYSAKKVKGERMYAAARRGEAVELAPVEVTIDAIRLLRFAPPLLDIEVDCGSGTYIRAIARDLGEALGVGAHLRRLRRTRIGRVEVGAALPLEALEDGDAVRRALLSPAEALAHMGRVSLEDPDVDAIRHGRAIAAPTDDRLEGPVALVDTAGALLAVGEQREGRIRPRKVFA